MTEQSDYLIIGAGIIGLAIARELHSRNPKASITIIEKEPDVAYHSSGRNSGVLHAGFYYSADSLKARFTRDGNFAMKDFCRQKGLKLNECQKVVVAKDESELEPLYELDRRGKRNGVDVKIITEAEICNRGFYTGIFGYFSGNVLDSGVMIRFIENTEKGMVFKSGGGITSFSNVEKEYNELIDKVYLTVKR